MRNVFAVKEMRKKTENELNYFLKMRFDKIIPWKALGLMLLLQGGLYKKTVY